jgi:hypothetical protein
VRATILLCDNAQAVNGKLYIMGGSWNMTGPDPVTMGVAIQILVPWDESNRRHEFRLQMLTLDGNPAIWQTPAGPQGLDVRGQFETGRPPGIPQGIELPAVLAINFAGIPLAPGGYEMRVTIDSQTNENWRAVFNVRERPQVPSPPVPPSP